MATTSAEEEDSPTHRAFLQRRLALLGAVGFGINSFGLFFQWLDADDALRSVPVWLSVGTGAAQAVMWLICRGLPRSARFLRSLEALMLMMIASASGLMAHALPAQNFGAFGSHAPVESSDSFYSEIGPMGAYFYIAANCTLALTQTFVLRAAVVPSSARRTLALTVAGGLLLVIVFAVPIPSWEEDAGLRGAMPFYAPIALGIATAVWWTMTTAVCVVTSWVVHGLRREIRHARQLGQYQLEAKLGEGGMGVVYRARHALLRRPTAVKILPPERGEGLDLARFEREVRTTARLSHPNTIRIFDYGRTPDGLFYYAMELLDGASLTEVVGHTGPMPPERCVHVLRHVASALVEAHEQGLIHRDIKPGNIVLCTQGGVPDEPKLLDFGLVKQLEAGGAQLSRDQSILGTPAYLAPEVIRGSDAASPRSDIYALGAVGYFLLTGGHVFDGETVIEVCSRHLTEAPVPPSQRRGERLPEALEELILECLAKDPADRPASARHMRARLSELEGVGRWTEEERTSWWEAHRETLTREVELGDADTLVVDLAPRRRRAPSTPPA